MQKMNEDAQAARREYMRKWREANRERTNNYMQKWRAENPEKVSAINSRYWAKKAAEDRAQVQYKAAAKARLNAEARTN